VYGLTAARVLQISALDDQALAGVLMWVLGSIAFLLPAHRASSSDISSTRSDRPIARPMVCTCSACVSDCGPVRTYSAPVA
jgi:hypothetical protein